MTKLVKMTSGLSPAQVNTVCKKWEAQLSSRTMRQLLDGDDELQAVAAVLKRLARDQEIANRVLKSCLLTRAELGRQLEPHTRGKKVKGVPLTLAGNKRAYRRADLRKIKKHEKLIDPYVDERTKAGRTAGEDGLLQEIRELERQQRDAEFDAAPGTPGGRASVILCDPPWRYEHQATSKRAIELPAAGRKGYPTMTLEELCNVDVDEWAAKDAALFMWATSPKLAEALELLEAWCFDYKTCAVWDKEVIGQGYWFRQQHELLLVGTRGNPRPPSASRRPSSVFRDKRRRHSEKPDCVHEALEAMFPKARKLELFARKTRKGWQSWGNEV